MAINPYNPLPHLNIVDDGTYWNFQLDGTTYFRIRKSDGVFQTTDAIHDNAF